MRIRIARPTGFCFGVRRAVRKLEEALERGEEVWTYGPIIHNPRAVERFAARGAKEVSDLDEVPPGSVVVIRSHGVGPEVYERARELNLTLIDGTCPWVRAAQRHASRFKEAGYHVVVIGQKGHPEVEGIFSWAGGERTATVVADEDEARRLPAYDRIGVVVQTTQRPEVAERVIEAIRARCPHVEVRNTICDATAERQEAARRLATTADVMVVVGGRNSSNTRKLYQICEGTGTRSYLVEGPEELRPEWFGGAEEVGLVAGASTPDWIIKEVVRKMEEIKETQEELKEQKEQEAAPASEEAEGSVAAGEELEEESMQDTEAIDFTPLKEGSIIKGRVISVSRDNVLVDIGYKTDGVIPAWEVSREEGKSPDEVVNVGDEIDVYVLAVDGPEGIVRLSKRRADEVLAWEQLEEAYETGRLIEAPVVEEVKGGLMVDVGLRGFMPASHVERGYVSDLSQYVGKNVRVKVIELDRHKNRIILSQKVVLEEEYEKKRQETWATIEEGQIRHGVVKSITDFGAFVDIGGVDGLLHVSELSWGRVEHPSDVVHEGQELDVMVLRVDRERERISLGLKQTLPDPWVDVEKKYHEGEIVEGKVVRLVGFGAFVELEPGVEGLIHISQLARRRVATPDEVVSEGQTVKVKILKVNAEQRRISLSLKDAQQEEEKKQMKEYMSRDPERVTLGDMFGDLLEETRERLNSEE